MGDITHELASEFFRRASPCLHCCTYNRPLEYPSKVTLSLPRWDPVRDYRWYPDMGESRYFSRRPYYCRWCDSTRCYCDMDMNVGISRYMDKAYYWDQKYSMLDNWFKRFDFDNDGYLSLGELKCLLDRLGVPVRHFNVKNVFDRADRDCDGKLSFQEFLLMWRIAASFEISNGEGCEELQAVIRQHQLYPDVIEHSENQHLRYDPRIMEDIRPPYPSYRCSCCRYGIPINTDDSRTSSPAPSTMTVVNKEDEKKAEPSPPGTPDLTKKTIFSCNRYSIY